jgi:hypothetical protein
MNPLIFTVASHLLCNMVGHFKNRALFVCFSISNHVFSEKLHPQPLNGVFLLANTTKKAL